MQKQQTIKAKIEYTGLDFYGGNEVTVTLSPAEEDHGLVFRTKRGTVKARIDNSSSYKSSILLKNNQIAVLHPEHILATLFAYGIDNAIIDVKRKPTRSFKFLEFLGCSTDIEVIPVSQDRELTLCNRIEEVGLEQQNKDRKLLTIMDNVETPRLSFIPLNYQGLVFEATTNYEIPGLETVTISITPKTYKRELARSRMFAKHVPPWANRTLASVVASLINPTFGIGHGFSESTVFFPPQNLDEWRIQEIYHGEIARHTIVDRLGAIALLHGRIDRVKVITRFSGHANDLSVLKNVLPRYLVSYNYEMAK